MGLEFEGSFNDRMNIFSAKFNLKIFETQMQFLIICSAEKLR